MNDRIRLSDLASYYLRNVKSRLNLYGQPNYVPMRIAFGRSVQTNREPIFEGKDPEILQKAKAEKGGEQPNLFTFEQQQGLFFRAIIAQRHKRPINDEEYVDLITQHVEHGLWLMYRETEKLKGYDYLVALANNARTHLVPTDNPEAPIASPNHPPGVLSVRIGIQKGTNKPIDYAINVTNNPHFGVMGGSGSGKTYFLKHLLRQVRQNSNYETNFLIFDYAKGDIAGDHQFVNDTRATVIDVKRQPLPLNIFADAAHSEAEQRAKAEKIVGVFKNVEASFGKVQEEGLYNSIIEAYQNTSPYPDFDTIREEVLRITNRPDTLTSILRPLVEQHYFATAQEPIWQTWWNRTTVVDLHQIERKDLVCFLILDKVFEELKRLGDAPYDEEHGARKIRTVIVIDEAHNFLGVAKRAKVLESMIREIRSMGGAVVLASQSPDDYNTTNFDFLELLEFPIVLSCKPQSHRFLEQKFSLTTQEAKELLRDVGKLNRGEGYLLWGKGVVLGELCK